MSTTRCNVAERRAFAEHAAAWRGSGQPPVEPAMGTLEQRLDILIVRFGGRLRVQKPTAEELASVVTFDDALSVEVAAA